MYSLTGMHCSDGRFCRHIAHLYLPMKISKTSKVLAPMTTSCANLATISRRPSGITIFETTTRELFDDIVDEIHVVYSSLVRVSYDCNVHLFVVFWGARTFCMPAFEVLFSQASRGSGCLHCSSVFCRAMDKLTKAVPVLMLRKGSAGECVALCPYDLRAFCARTSNWVWL
mmetsp:Transcript_41549/g.103281  ORF Transcript_41549/g.103281 Transcript_41549/m.103281 type:complete len:171 (+) Transcript_41549:522-1034(+)